MRRSQHLGSGLTLVEVVIALAMLAIVVAAFTGLRVSNLRSTRSSIETRTATGLLAYEVGIRSVLPSSGGDCLGATWVPAGWSCRVSVDCLTHPTCDLQRIEVELGLTSGRSLTASVIVHSRLESAAFRPVEPAGTPPSEPAP